MSKFNALYNKIIPEQAVLPPAHREGLKPHMKMAGDIVKRQNINIQPEAINSIMQGVTSPTFDINNLNKYGVELPNLVKKIRDYIQQQPVEHRADIIEQVRQTITHPINT